MTTTDPLSLTEAKRLAPNADTILLRAAPGRPRDADRRLPAPRRRRPGLPAGVRRGRRAARTVLVPGRRAAAAARGPRRAGERPDPARDGSRVHPGPARRLDRRARPARRDPRVRPAPPRPADRGHARFTGGAVGALAYDAVSLFEPTVPQPERDPVGAPTAAFIETDLVLVFDHLTHTLSAIASLHTEAPDLEGRYRIAETAIFEALERTARPGASEMSGAAPQPPRLPCATTGSRRAWSRGVHPRGRGRQGRDRRRGGDPGRPRPAPVVRPAG